MNLKRLIQGFFLSLISLFVLGFFGWGMWRLSASLDNFFQFKLSQEKNRFLGSVSEIVNDNSLQQEFPQRDQSAADLELEATSAILLQTDFANSLSQISQSKTWEGKEKILFKKNEEEKMPIASLTKLMTAVIIIEKFDLSEDILISKDAEKQDARGFLKAGESFIAKDLLYDMLIESNNAAAYAFFEAMGSDKFIKSMNLKANEIGLENTYFSSSTGLELTNYSTVKDLADFAKYILNKNNKNNLIVEITSIPEFDLYDSNGTFHHKVYNLNDLLKDPQLNNRIIAGKTGQTKEAGECLLLILKAPENKGYLIIVVLNAKDRFAEMKKIINWSDSAYKWK